MPGAGFGRGEAGAVAARIVPAASAPNPWSRPGSGAALLLERSREPALPFATRLAAARTWAALATQGPAAVCSSGRHAALCAAFGLLLAAPVDRPAWEALGGAADEESAAGTVARFVFGEADAPALASIALVLAHGRRIGLDTTGFARLLGQQTPEALAAEELRLRNGPSAPADAPSDEGTMAPGQLDHAVLIHLASSPAFRPDMPAALRRAA